MSVHFHQIELKTKLKNKSKIKKWIYSSIENYNYKTGTINIILVKDSYLLELNKKYLLKDYLTDIITFNYNWDNFIEGDLYISLERVIENSDIYSKSLSDELLRVIIHGILHLIGFDDETQSQKQIMRKKEDLALKEIKGLEII